MIYGAGIIGSVYAAKLFEADYQVSLLARGQRYKDLERDGVMLRDAVTGIKTTAKVPLIKELKPSDVYDLIIVTVRLDQLDSAVSDLRSNKTSSRILFMQNNPADIASLKKVLPNKHLIFGFPGVGGTFLGKTIDFVRIKQQKTTIGELDGIESATMTELRTLFESAGFRTEISLKMQDWLKTHALFISCITASIIDAHGDSVRLAKDKNSIRMMVQSIKEGFTALEALGISIEPRNLKVIFVKVPRWFSILYWRKAMRSDLGKLAIAPHAVVATEEMQLVAEKILAIANSSSISTPTLNRLLTSFINKKQN